MFENLDDPRKQALLALAAGLFSPVRGKGFSGFGEALGQGVNAGLLGFNQAQRTQEAVKRGEMDRRLEQMRLDQAKRQQEYQTGFDALSKQYFQPGYTPTTSVDELGIPIQPVAPKNDFAGFVEALPTLGHQGVKDALGYQQLLAKETPYDKPKPEHYTPGSLAEFAKTKNPAVLVRYEAPKENWGPVSPQDIQAFRLPQNGQGFQKNSVTGQIRAVGSVPQQVNVNAQLPASEAAQAEFMKGTRATYDALKQAPATLRNMEAMKALVPEAMQYMGPGGEGFLVAAKALKKGGINIDPEAIKSAEQLRSRLAFGVIENLKKMDSQPSERQQEFLANAQGTLATDPSALPGILDAWAEMLREKVAIHNSEVNSAVSRGVRFPYDPVIKLPDKAKAQGVSISGTTVTLSDGRSIPFPSEAAAKAYAAEAKKRGW